MTNFAKVDHANRRIVMDRTFAKNAEYVGSPEYNKLQLCRRDYPEYTVVRRTIKKNSRQERYGGLTYSYMEDYIRTHETEETGPVVLAEYWEMRLTAEGHSRAFRYPTIKQWFLERYPEYAQFGKPPAAKDEVIEVVGISTSATTNNTDCTVYSPVVTSE